MRDWLMAHLSERTHIWLKIMEIERINALSNQLADLQARIDALWGYL
jgi:hypothetical protein